MSWGYVFLVFTLLCGAAISAYLVVQSTTYLGQSFGSLTPAKRRQFAWMLLGTAAFMLVAAALIAAAYTWGSSAWSTSTGAAIAIATFVLILIVVFVGFGIQIRREARQAREHPTPAPE